MFKLIRNSRWYQIGFLTLILCFLASCSKNTDVTPSSSNNTADINTWIYNTMNDVYFWYDQMPALSSLNTAEDTDSFFEKLVYQRSTVDRFSMVTDDADALEQAFKGVSKILGIRYVLGYLDNTHSNMGLFLSYVVPTSPAANASLQRGDIVVKVNGQNITASNYTTLLGNNSVTFTLGKISSGTIVEDSKTVTLTKTEVTENPVGFSTIIQKQAANKTIGYLVYTQFIPGLETGDAQLYDNQLRQIFSNFKNQGVNELVLDLRFNPGGYISSATTLASLIVKNLSAGKVFFKNQYNQKYQDYYQKMYGAKVFNNYFTIENSNIGNNLTRVFVLTSNNTASASELVINGLKPYMDVITIGEHTYGKNLFGTIIGDDKNRWKWGLYVMLGQTTNVNGESDYGTVNGITPTYTVADNVIPFKAFGDDTEPLFRKALQMMGVSVSAGPGGRVEATQSIEMEVHEHLSDTPNSVVKRMIIK